jgi:hypothetical protein
MLKQARQDLFHITLARMKSGRVVRQSAATVYRFYAIYYSQMQTVTQGILDARNEHGGCSLSQAATHHQQPMSCHFRSLQGSHWNPQKCGKCPRTFKMTPYINAGNTSVQHSVVQTHRSATRQSRLSQSLAQVVHERMGWANMCFELLWNKDNA